MEEMKSGSTAGSCLEQGIRRSIEPYMREVGRSKNSRPRRPIAPPGDHKRILMATVGAGELASSRRIAELRNGCLICEVEWWRKSPRRKPCPRCRMEAAWAAWTTTKPEHPAALCGRHPAKGVGFFLSRPVKLFRDTIPARRAGPHHRHFRLCRALPKAAFTRTRKSGLAKTLCCASTSAACPRSFSSQNDLCYASNGT
jgi:hypothetical protein